MLQRHVQVFNSDPTLLSYLADYLRARSCNILEEEGKFYLRSSYFEQLPVLPNGLGAVLELINPAFATLATSIQVEQCIQALLFVLNGILKLKYKSDGLQRVKYDPPPMMERGTDYSVDSSGQRIYTASRNVTGRLEIKFSCLEQSKVVRTRDTTE